MTRLTIPSGYCNISFETRQKIHSLASQLINVAEKLGKEIPKEPIDEPDCNLLHSDQYLYEDDDWRISTSTSTTHTVNGVIDDWFVDVTYKGQHVFNAAESYNDYHDPTQEYYARKTNIYSPGPWEQEVDKFFKKTKSLNKKKVDAEQKDGNNSENNSAEYISVAGYMIQSLLHEVINQAHFSESLQDRNRIFEDLKVREDSERHIKGCQKCKKLILTFEEENRKLTAAD